MGFRRIEECQAWQLARAFKREVYRIVRSCPEANRDFKFRDQIFDAASSGQANIEEGFGRLRSTELLQFLSYARASIAEARGRLEDGIDREYFGADQIAEAQALSARALGAIAAWQRSLRPFLRKSATPGDSAATAQARDPRTPAPSNRTEP